MRTAAFAGAQPVFPTVSTNTRSICSRTPKCVADSQAPPESRVQPYYPKDKRFQAPHLSFADYQGFELLNKIGLVMEEVELDLETAAAIKGAAIRQTIASEEDFAELFTGDITDEKATIVDEKYYPFSRRFETPVIEITPPTNPENENSGEVKISIGQVIATPPPEPVDERPDGFWKYEAAPTASAVVETNFPPMLRHLAPVIEFPPGKLSISMHMGEIKGEPDAPLYPIETRFLAPIITMKPPAGDWDTSAYVNVEMGELQLPILDTVA